MLTAISITINVFLIIGVIVFMGVFAVFSEWDDDLRDENRKALKAIDSYRMYVSSMYDNIYEGISKCTEIEQLEWKYEDK